MELKIVDNSSYEPRLLPKYVILGMLDEYLGRQILEGSPYVEGFYSNEADVIEHFLYWLDQLNVEHDLSDSYEIQGAPNSNRAVHSPALAPLIDSWYPHHFGDRTFTDQDGKVHRLTDSEVDLTFFPGKKPIGNFKSEEVDPRYSYLYGAYIRYGQNSTITLANARSKVRVILQLLEDVECDWIEHRWSLKGAPTMHRIRFGPAPSLARLLKIPPPNS